MKPLEFLGSSQDDLKNFPAEARRATGFELHFVQQGLMPADWKPMPQVGQGAMEIRIHVLGEWRVIYVAKFADAVYVLHAFQKRPGRPDRKISNSHASAIAQLEASDEKRNHKILRQRVYRSWV